ncbi:MAG TPA: heavy-metal-associated domain-containing protein [Burkholderiaceae bacterium]|nr:heavy-metal-associated domain-containing protein [Burkholderiaceae bacterium]
MRTETVKIVDMADQQAAENIARALAQLEGVDEIQISLDDRKATVSFDETVASRYGVTMAIEDLGFEVAQPVHGEDGVCCGGCGG